MSRRLASHEQERDAMEESRKRLIVEVSHDLKTPLASVQGYTERALSRIQNLNEEMAGLEQIRKDIEIAHHHGIRANELIHSLQYYSQLESNTYELHMEKRDLCEVVRRIVADDIPLLEEQGFSYEAAIPDTPCYVMMDVSLVQRAMENLLYNALRYNPAGTSIMVMVEEREQSTTVIVRDNGNGMNLEETATIFESFVRGDDKVRNSNDGGSGLRLAIVKKAMEIHRGQVMLTTALGKGCEFCLIFPRE